MLKNNKSAIISLSSIRRTVVYHFESIKYKNHQQSSDGSGSRRSLRFMEHTSSQSTVATSNNESHVKKVPFNLNSIKLRRYIIKDAMYIKPGEDILVLICNDSLEFAYWNTIIEEQNAGLSTLTFGSKTF